MFRIYGSKSTTQVKSLSHDIIWLKHVKLLTIFFSYFSHELCLSHCELLAYVFIRVKHLISLQTNERYLYHEA